MILKTQNITLNKRAPNLFSIISFNALAGRCIISPAAILLTTVSSNLRMTGAEAIVFYNDLYARYCHIYRRSQCASRL